MKHEFKEDNCIWCGVDVNSEDMCSIGEDIRRIIKQYEKDEQKRQVQYREDLKKVKEEYKELYNAAQLLCDELSCLRYSFGAAETAALEKLEKILERDEWENLYALAVKEHRYISFNVDSNSASMKRWREAFEKEDIKVFPHDIIKLEHYETPEDDLSKYGGDVYLTGSQSIGKKIDNSSIKLMMADIRNLPELSMGTIVPYLDEWGFPQGVWKKEESTLNEEVIRVGDIWSHKEDKIRVQIVPTSDKCLNKEDWISYVELGSKSHLRMSITREYFLKDFTFHCTEGSVYLGVDWGQKVDSDDQDRAVFENDDPASFKESTQDKDNRTHCNSCGKECFYVEEENYICWSCRNGC